MGAGQHGNKFNNYKDNNNHYLNLVHPAMDMGCRRSAITFSDHCADAWQ
jgi:hypothetical protein